MAWREQLRTASFRGVPFHYRDAGGDFGRRLARHDYPGRDLSYHEDLGRKTREFTIRAFVLGPDYAAARDALIEAVETPGPGTLVHPYLGSLTVAVTAARLRESTAEGGAAEFDLSFEETGENRYPERGTDTAAAVDAASDEALIAVSTDFESAFGTAGKASWVGEQAQGLAGDALSDIGGAAGGLSGDASKSAALAKSLAAAKSDLAALAADPSKLAATVIGLISGSADFGAGGRGLLAALALLDEFGGDLAPQPETTATRRAAGANQTALVALVRRAAAVEAARASAGLVFASFDEAAATRDTLAARLDGLMLQAGDLGDDAAWRAMGALRAAMLRDLAARGSRLPRTVTVTPAATRPALALANDHYGADPDAVLDRADELTSRNRVRHPLFVPGAEPLRLLTAGA